MLGGTKNIAVILIGTAIIIGQSSEELDLFHVIGVTEGTVVALTGLF